MEFFYIYFITSYTHRDRGINVTETQPSVIHVYYTDRNTIYNLYVCAYLTAVTKALEVSDRPLCLVHILKNFIAKLYIGSFKTFLCFPFCDNFFFPTLI